MIPGNSLEALEFHKLLGIISGFANSVASREAVLNLVPLAARPEIEERFSIIGDIMRLSQEKDSLRLSEFPDISSLMERVRPEDAVLDASELAGFMPILRIGASIRERMSDRQDLESLARLVQYLTGHPDILEKLERSIDDEGNILDSASFLLSDLRKQIRGLENRIRKRLEKIVRDDAVDVFLQDDFITKRAGRWVIPVRMDSKGMVEGVVHDVSKSGETAFVEPLSIISLVNKLENLVAEQKAEEIRMLKELCSRIRSVADDIFSEFQTIVYLDVLCSLSGFAEERNMEVPLLNDSGDLDIKNGRHPLLTFSLSTTGPGDGIVPLNVVLGQEDTVMVITGPNAGGKTVAIKTIGLLVLMAMTGIPVPADSSSSIPILQGVLVDMGDEQSIEHNLSTFSAHISNISTIIKNAGARTVILIDELGTGTDPEEGTAIACAVLNEIKEKNALVFATTHLMGIKGFVQRTGGMVNASMEFDQNNLIPLYKLRAGEPGQSHAIEIARQFGLPEKVIAHARELLGSGNVTFDNLIADLNKKRTRYEKELDDIEKRKHELGGLKKQWEDRVAEIENEKKKVLADASEDAADIMAQTKREMHAMLEEMKKKSRPEGKTVIKELEKRQKEMSEKIQELRPAEADTPDIDDIKAGDTVFVATLGYDVTIAEVDRKRSRLRVRAGSLEIEVPLSEVSPGKGIVLETGSDEMSDEPEGVVLSKINLVGLRADDALSRLEPFLNHAVLGGLRELVIIHGIGEGILLKVIRNYLKDHPLVKEFRNGEQSEGGGGVTIVTLK